MTDEQRKEIDEIFERINKRMKKWERKYFKQRMRWIRNHKSIPLK